MTRFCNARRTRRRSPGAMTRLRTTVPIVWWKRGLVAAVFLLMPITGIWLAGSIGDPPAGAEGTDRPSAVAEDPMQQ